MAAQFHPLSPQTDYSIASTSDNDNGMDEISLASSSHITSQTTKSKIISSGASVSSKFSRVSKRTVSNNIDNSDLGVPLTSSTSLDDQDDNQDNYTDNETGSYIGAQTPNTQQKKSYISEDDPFYIFRTDLEQKLTQTSNILSTYLQLVQTTDTSINPEIKEYKKQLKRYIKQCESTINDLTTTIKVVTNNRSKFVHITNKELNDRQEFVNKSSDTIVKIKLDMNSDDVKEKIRIDELALRERRQKGSGGGKGSGSDNVATAIATPVGLPVGRNGYSKAQDLEEGGSSERAETLLMMKQQDETLTDLDMAVTRVGYMVSFCLCWVYVWGCCFAHDVHFFPPPRSPYQPLFASFVYLMLTLSYFKQYQYNT